MGRAPRPDRRDPQRLQARGVGRGDRVAAYLPNVPETVAAFLACASLGAVWSSAAPEFGVRSVVDRFAQIEPKVLLAVDGYRYGGKDFDRRAAVDELRARARPEHVFVLPYLGDEGNWDELYGDGALEFDAAAVRPPALGALLVGHHGPAEADRPRAGRDPARASQGAEPAPRPARRRPALLVHDDRLDDVELPRRRTADARRRSCSTTGTPAHRASTGSGSSRPTPASPASARAPRSSARARRPASARAPAATSRGCAASARPARRSRRRASAGSTTSSGATCGSSRRAAAPTSAPRSSAACRRSRCTRASSRRARSARRSRRSTKQAARWSARWGSWC